MSGETPGLDRLRAAFRTQITRAAVAAGYANEGSIPASMTFIQWCERLADNGLLVDGHPWSLDDRPSLRPLYEAIPSTIAEAHRRTLVLRKGSQLGATLWECLADLYMAIKFEPCVVGLYLPDQATAADKSQRRFLRIIRSIPEAYRRLTTRVEPDGSVINVGTGNIMTRIFGESAFLFLWTSSVSATESRPCDILSYDEVQNMSLGEIDRVNERMSASRIRFRLLLSTANIPNNDIDRWYQLGDQRAFFTECPACLAMTNLPERWPGICQFNTGQIRDAPLNEWTYVCPECAGPLADPQRGRFIAQNPGSNIESWHLSQFQSPTIDAREMAETWARSITGDQKKQWYNRKAGMGYIDREQLPVDMAACLACVADGLAEGLTWQKSGRDTFMGLDQMGSFVVAIIMRRHHDGRQAVVHVEAIFSDDPFARCGELMNEYGVAVCCVETLPNVNDARRFTNRFAGRVYLAKYATGHNSDMIAWGDAAGLRSDQKTVQEDRDRYAVTLQQYKAMQMALFRIKQRETLFPDPALLEQDVLEAGLWTRIPITHDWVFGHFCKTALVVEQDEDTRTPKPKVVKIGIDPHFSFAFMLAQVAWSRVHGQSMFIMQNTGKGPRDVPDLPLAQKVDKQMPGLPREVLAMLDEGRREGTCGVCENFQRPNVCSLRQLLVAPSDVSCPLYEYRQD